MYSIMKFRADKANLIKLSGDCSLDKFISDFHSFVCEHVKNLNQDNIDPSLVRTLCNWIENAFQKNCVADEKVDKKKIVIDEYLKLKPHANNPETVCIIEKLIEDFHNAGQIVKVPVLKYIYKSCKKFVLKKL